MTISTSETTSFRPTDRIDTSGTPLAAVYDIQDAARVRVWSKGGFIGVGGAAMAHVGIHIANLSGHGIEFECSSFELAIFHESGVQLPDPMLAAYAPPGPSLMLILPRTGATLDLYFELVVQLQLVASMRASWFVVVAEQRIGRTTNFVRDGGGQLRSRLRSPRDATFAAPGSRSE